MSEAVWIPLADGTRLSARIWRPDGAERVPAILEYLPYRHRDGTWDRDALTHPWFAAHGYGGVRVDLRGSGESDGLLFDEYARQEQDDALEIIAWIARQPWCSGAVGMMGISWGGFNALQLAALRPPALRAIITAAGAGRRARGHCLDRPPALVLRRGRHDGHLLGRVQRVAARRAPPPGAARYHHGVLHR